MRTTLALLPLLGACDFFESIGDAIDGAVDPIVAVGVVAVVEDPVGLPEGLDLPEGFDAGVSATMFLADARNVTELDQAPISGASLEVRGCGERAALTDLGQGAYGLAGAQLGCEEDALVVGRTDVDPPARLPVTVPASLDPDMPPLTEAGVDMVLDLSGADWTGAVVVVADLSDGAVTYTSRPDDIVGWYELLRGQQDLSAVAIPGSAFREDAVHVVGITGLVRTPGGELEEVNTVLSTVAGGREIVRVVGTGG